MEGEGSLKNWLKQTGREVARAAGSELKSVAKNRVAAYASEMIGEGLKEELGDAAGAVGKAAMTEARKHGKHKAKELIAQYFGGDGISRPCALKIGELRKAVTAARRSNNVVGTANRTQLMALGEAHADGFSDNMSTRVEKVLASTPLTVPMLRQMRAAIKAHYHPAVSKMSREDVIRYVYSTAKHLGRSRSRSRRARLASLRPLLLARHGVRACVGGVERPAGCASRRCRLYFFCVPRRAPHSVDCF
eukprot:COSAG06_NODE_14496_length_1151_cov_1.443916_2_plen_248_part_00